MNFVWEMLVFVCILPNYTHYAPFYSRKVKMVKYAQRK